MRESSLRARLERRLGSLPPDYELVTGARGFLAVRRELRAELLASGFGPDDQRSLERAELSGRAAMYAIELESGPLLVRRFRHGGVFRGLSRERFSRPDRPFRELLLSSELGAAGIPTPVVAAARAQRLRPFGWRLEIATRKVRGAVDLLRALERSSQQTSRRRLFRETGEFVGRLHRAGLLHADLTPRNLLLEESFFRGAAAKLWVLDLDRSELRPPLREGERLANLARLLRFVQRRAQRGELELSRTEAWRFVQGYGEGLGAIDFDPGAAARAIERRARAALWLHRAGWFLEEALGAGPAARDGRPT